MGHFAAQRRPAQMRFLFHAEHGDNFCLPSKRFHFPAPLNGQTSSAFVAMQPAAFRTKADCIAAQTAGAPEYHSPVK